ncbi:hypothetical protein M5K25_026100 [Dendrobium thyrsiflorum]|uniref:Uncharacterized protein n=1 Tax=Dendrobium thyrsiflorum TaxID=117978 RepID=A0ABD0TWD5_DENTH
MPTSYCVHDGFSTSACEKVVVFSIMLLTLFMDRSLYVLSVPYCHLRACHCTCNNSSAITSKYSHSPCAALRMFARGFIVCRQVDVLLCKLTLTAGELHSSLILPTQTDWEIVAFRAYSMS